MSIMSDTEAAVRIMLDDITSPPSHSVRKENLRQSVIGDQVDGTNKNFILNNRKLIASSLVVVADNVVVTPTVIDLGKGIFTLTAAPTTSLIVRYDYNFFTDTEIDAHITEGLRFVGIQVIDNVDFGLMKALEHKAAASAFEELASRTAQLFDASAGGKTLSKASIKSHYLELAKYHHDKADKERLAFYERQGRREAPAYGGFSTKQSPYTPRR